MLIVHVHVKVKADCIDDFITATVENASNSIQEHGIARFDVVQQQDDPTQFILVEVYHSEEDAARHKETSHYKEWRDTVADMMAEPRKGVKYDNIFPYDEGWEKP